VGNLAKVESMASASGYADRSMDNIHSSDMDLADFADFGNSKR